MIRVLAPAKVNLGLDILGKRDDGYHEVRSILCAVSVFDTVDFEPTGGPGLFVSEPALQIDNLVERVLRMVADHAPDLDLPAIRLRKRIPAAAGLGGASSDAAAALLALQRLHPHALDECMLRTLASKLGSDVPFFLASGRAFGSGRGDSLQQLPYQRVDIVIVNPPASIADKTATMYSLLEPSDWTDGSTVELLAKELQSGSRFPLDSPLPNAFTRPLYAFRPELSELSARMSALTGLMVSLSGAGPAHFVVCRDVEHRQYVRNRLREDLRATGIRVLAGRSVPSVLMRAT